ncbi:Glycerophosphoryl diester phosphodiesterase [Streptomyces sp. YIM 130001]|uniref:glycerophosphodiester phosphodiesterase n=1 Tax=Streptomyces sp. YIM 130001 TaxID=2259644 RepID=UPI000E65A250|nr:glycerophosphodiester phosphodiesterase family protein [Streptomyces sp. YIM 130001]RII18460.1 Glycerophosphoryl diester phosphodiesterase [Streptomyces sp. YIM 130001]
MYARVAAAGTATLVGAAALLLPAATAHADSTTDEPVVVAHRGASAYAPENTLAAVDKAAELGVRWVENDVQRTKDGELVVVHDTTLTRTTNVEEVFPDRAPWNVADFTSAEIAKLDAGSWFDAKYAGARVPTLEQYMNRVSRHDQKLVLELKAPDLYPGIEKQTLRELRRSGWLDRQHVKRKLVIQSFDAASVRTVHSLRPDIKTGFLGTPAVADLPEYAKFADQINSSHTTISADYVSAIQSLKGPKNKPLEIYTWTVDDIPNAVRVAAYGVDGIISNAPDVVGTAVGKG